MGIQDIRKAEGEGKEKRKGKKKMNEHYSAQTKTETLKCILLK